MSAEHGGPGECLDGNYDMGSTRPPYLPGVHVNEPMPLYEPHPTLPHRFINVDRPDDPLVTVEEILAENHMWWGRQLDRCLMILEGRPKRSLWRWFKRG